MHSSYNSRSHSQYPNVPPRHPQPQPAPGRANVSVPVGAPSSSHFGPAAARVPQPLASPCAGRYSTAPVPASSNAYPHAQAGTSQGHSPAPELPAVNNVSGHRARHPRTPCPEASDSSSSGGSKQPSPENIGDMLGRSYSANQEDGYQTSPPHFNMVPGPVSPTPGARRAAVTPQRAQHQTRMDGFLTARGDEDGGYDPELSPTPRRLWFGAPAAGHSVPLQQSHVTPPHPYPDLFGAEHTTPTAGRRSQQPGGY